MKIYFLNRIITFRGMCKIFCVNFCIKTFGIKWIAKQIYIWICSCEITQLTQWRCLNHRTDKGCRVLPSQPQLHLRWTFPILCAACDRNVHYKRLYFYHWNKRTKKRHEQQKMMKGLQKQWWTFSLPDNSSEYAELWN